MNDIFENFLSTGKKDSKGRDIGYVIGLRDDGTTFFAWVQNTRRVNGEWKEFGVQQRSKAFTSQAGATHWAYATAKERIAKLAA
jgi:hypothetical protein